MNKSNKNEIFLRDIQDQSVGLKPTTMSDSQITIRENLFFVDSRDCIGLQSLQDAQNFSLGRGARKSSSGNILNISDTSPIVITIDKTTQEVQLKDNDKIEISGTYANNGQGSININGIYIITNVGYNTFELYGSFSNGSISGGIWKRPSDLSYPVLNQQDNTIIDNVMTIKLNHRIRAIKSLTLINSIIPRDIIPIMNFMPDLFGISTSKNNSMYPTYIPQQKQFYDSLLLGIFSTPLSCFRTYINGAYSLPSQITPQPLRLWNPPLGAWPLQPLSYPYQTVPTYVSNYFSIKTGPFTSVPNYYLVLSGYGVYDFKDFTTQKLISIPVAPFTIDIGRMITDFARKLLLLCITRPQSYVPKDANGNPIGTEYDYIDLIFNCDTTSNDSYVDSYGYGDFQRFIPGPGLQMNYQPGTSDGADPTVAGAEWPVPFPNFRGNVWGPYDSPGDRFQKVGLLQTVQDLFLNGDLDNLNGDPIIKENVLIEDIMEDPTFGINFNSMKSVTLENVETSQNLNILNAMSIMPNGFGTNIFRALGSGTVYSKTYLNGGGMGPDPLGPPPTGPGWTDNGLGFGINSGLGTFSDPIASGPEAGYSTVDISNGITPQVIDASILGNEIIPTTPMITNRVSWNNTNSMFKSGVDSWLEYLYREVQETNIVVTVLQGERDIRVQGSNTKTYGSILSCPIRLSLGSDTGSLKYMETIQAFLANSELYWEKRFMPPLASMDYIKLQFTTFEGLPIPIEKMLQERSTVDFLRMFERFYGYDETFNTQELHFLYDPLNPKLVGRVKRNLSFVFKIETYEFMDPGFDINIIKNILGAADDSDSESDNKKYAVKASNYQLYQSMN